MTRALTVDERVGRSVRSGLVDRAERVDREAATRPTLMLELMVALDGELRRPCELADIVEASLRRPIYRNNMGSYLRRLVEQGAARRELVDGRYLYAEPIDALSVREGGAA